MLLHIYHLLYVLYIYDIYTYYTTTSVEYTNTQHQLDVMCPLIGCVCPSCHRAVMLAFAMVEVLTTTNSIPHGVLLHR